MLIANSRPQFLPVANLLSGPLQDCKKDMGSKKATSKIDFSKALIISAPAAR
jgi:hypothetical protein